MIKTETRKRMSQAVKYVMFNEGFRTQKELAIALNIAPTNLSTALRCDSSYTEQLIRCLCKHYPYINKKYIKFGSGNLLVDGTIENDENDEQKDTASTHRIITETNPSSLFSANSEGVHVTDDAIGSIHFGSSSNQDICVRMVGQYMQPTIMNGSLMLISPINKDIDFIEYGNIYLLVLNDSRVIVRQIDGEDSESDAYICSCANAQNSVNICKNSIKDMFLVKAAINRLAM